MYDLRFLIPKSLKDSEFIHVKAVVRFCVMMTELTAIAVSLGNSNRKGW